MEGGTRTGVCRLYFREQGKAHSLTPSSIQRTRMEPHGAPGAGDASEQDGHGPGPHVASVRSRGRWTIQHAMGFGREARGSTEENRVAQTRRAESDFWEEATGRPNPKEEASAWGAERNTQEGVPCDGAEAEGREGRQRSVCEPTAPEDRGRWETVKGGKRGDDPRRLVVHPFPGQPQAATARRELSEDSGRCGETVTSVLLPLVDQEGFQEMQ